MIAIGVVLVVSPFLLPVAVGGVVYARRTFLRSSGRSAGSVDYHPAPGEESAVAREAMHSVVDSKRLWVYRMSIAISMVAVRVIFSALDELGWLWRQSANRDVSGAGDVEGAEGAANNARPVEEPRNRLHLRSALTETIDKSKPQLVDGCRSHQFGARVWLPAAAGDVHVSLPAMCSSRGVFARDVTSHETLHCFQHACHGILHSEFHGTMKAVCRAYVELEACLLGSPVLFWIAGGVTIQALLATVQHAATAEPVWMSLSLVATAIILVVWGERIEWSGGSGQEMARG
ncbi:hypothetical protein [Lacipirellula parvula]|uniref:hypothetical protein n=1 Tax=Lacipirellula parvula TaxID=2650471 RepID=UPI001260B70F|nr:hypothetical protein [Lacipirellula parvula]